MHLIIDVVILLMILPIACLYNTLSYVCFLFCFQVVRITQEKCVIYRNDF